MTGRGASVGFTDDRSVDCRGRRAAGRHGVDADDGVARGHLLIREIDPPVAMQHGLVMVRRPRERHVLLSARGLARVPRHDHAVVELVHGARAVHPLLEERRNERNLVDDVRTDLLQVDEAAEPEVVVAAAEGDEPGGRHLHRVPVLAGERELRTS